MHKRIICLSIFVCFTGSSNVRAADSAKEVVEKAIEAHGGATNLKKYSAGKTSAKGTLYILNQEVPVETESIYQLPDKLKNVVKMEIMGQKVNIVQVFNAGKLKMTTNDMDTPIVNAQKDEIKEALRLQAIQNIVGLLDSSNELSLIEKSEKVGDKEVVGILAKNKAFRDIRIFFDKKTGVLVKIERKGLGPAGNEVDQVMVYLELKKFDGILRPLKTELRIDGKVFLESETTNYKNLEKTEKKEFEISD